MDWEYLAVTVTCNLIGGLVIFFGLRLFLGEEKIAERVATQGVMGREVIRRWHTWRRPKE